MAWTQDDEIDLMWQQLHESLGKPLIPGGHNPSPLGQRGLPILDLTPAPPGLKLNQAPMTTGAKRLGELLMPVLQKPGVG